LQEKDVGGMEEKIRNRLKGNEKKKKKKESEKYIYIS